MSMDYIELNIPITDGEQGEIITAELADLPFESFTTEGDSVLKAYIPQQRLVDCKDMADAILERYGISAARYISIETQNWNQQWESNFERVEVGERLLIRAPFHPSDTKFEREVIIMPKMSFGTGHHATTHLMSEWIMDLGAEGAIASRTLLDMGSGTGVLAIIASKEGAAAVTAVDIDEWADENCRENIVVNGVEGVVTPLLGDMGLVEGERFDVVLANINRNILLADLHRYARCLNGGGVLLMSGFLEQDIAQIEARVREVGLTPHSHRVRGGWVAMQARKGEA